MRDKEEILDDLLDSYSGEDGCTPPVYSAVFDGFLEVLIDIRDLLAKKNVSPHYDTYIGTGKMSETGTFTTTSVKS